MTHSASVRDFDEAQRFSHGLPGAVAAALQSTGLFDGQPEQEEIFWANLPDFHIGAVQGAASQGAIKSKLHVARAASLLGMEICSDRSPAG